MALAWRPVRRLTGGRGRPTLAIVMALVSIIKTFPPMEASAMRKAILSLIVAVLFLMSANCATAQGQTANGPAGWKVIDQPELKGQLDKAPKANVEELAAPIRSVMPWGTNVVPNRDGKTFDILQWYIKEYRQKTRAYIADLGTGQVKLQTFPETEGKSRVEGLPSVLHPNGNMYGAAPDWSKWEGDGGMDIYCYDPDTNEMTKVCQVPHYGGEGLSLMLGSDGKLYGTGTYIKNGKQGQVGAYSLDPRTGEIRDYGPLGPDHGSNPAYAYWSGIDDTHLYIADGKIPWYLLALDLKTGECKMLMEAPPGDYPFRMRIFNVSGGCRVWVYSGGDGMNKEYEGGRNYWLHHGEAIAITEDFDVERGRPTPPWPKVESPWDKYPPRPEVYQGQLDPDANGRAYLWYRQEGVKPAGSQPADSPESKGWNKIVLENVETYPLPIHRLLALPDGRIFGTAPGYQGRFIFDPRTNKATLLGRGGSSIYTLIAYDGKIYWSGYSSAPVEVLDPEKPWTLSVPLAPGQKETGPRNPRHVGSVFQPTRVKKVFAVVAGADGKLYLGGVGQRDYTGGGLGWYDPKSGATGGMWEPFTGYGIHWLEPVLDGRLIVISTRTAKDEKHNNERPPVAKVFVYDVAAGKIVHEIVPVEGAQKLDKAGPLVEIAPGRVMGLTEDPETQGGGILYGLDVQTGAVLFNKKLPACLKFEWAQGTDKYGFCKGPDGQLYTFLGDVLVRIDPADGRVTPIGKVDSAQMVFQGRDLYLAGQEQLRRIKDLAQK